MKNRASSLLAQFLLDRALRRPFSNMLSLCHSFGFAEPVCEESGTYRKKYITGIFSMNVSKLSQLWDLDDPTQTHMCSIGPGNKTEGSNTVIVLQ